MAEYLVTLRYPDGITGNIYAKFNHKNPTRDEIDKVVREFSYSTNDFIHNKPTIIFMQKLYSEDKQ